MKNDNNRSQIIMFDHEGTILRSCDTLFQINHQLGNNIYTIFPLLSNYKKDLENLIEQSEPFFIPCMPFAHHHFKSICDFVFIRHDELQEIIFSWMISDNYIHFKNRIALKSQKVFRPIVVTNHASSQKKTGHR